MANVWNNSMVDSVLTVVFGRNWHPSNVTTAAAVIAAVAVVTAVIIWAMKVVHASSQRRGWGE